MYNIIMFDLDGTLTDTGEGVTNGFMYALKKFGITVENRTELYKFIGPPLSDSFKNFYGFSDEQTELAIKYYREYYSEKGIFENTVYDGIPELLQKLHSAGKMIITATSKPEAYAVKILEKLGISKYFTYIAGADFEGNRITKTAVIKYALERGKITDNSEIIMIGDRHYDVKGSAEFGIDCIGVLYGYGNADELKNAGAKYIAKDTKEIEKIIF